MKYILKDVVYNGSPTEKEGNIVEQNITVVTGIEGDIYGFIKTNSMTGVSSMNKTGAQIKEDILAQAVLFVEQNYPNT